MVLTRWRLTVKSLQLILSFLIPAIFAGEMTYTPINPAFGGSSFNAQWLMSDAQAQSEYTEKREDPFSYFSDPLQDFQESLNRQVLSRLSREIIDVAFGEGGEDNFKKGSYQIGDYHIEIDPSTDVIKIVIIDQLTGNNTTIEVPYYNTQNGGK